MRTDRYMAKESKSEHPSEKAMEIIYIFFIFPVVTTPESITDVFLLFVKLLKNMILGNRPERIAFSFGALKIS